MQYRSGQEIRDLFIKFWVEKGSHHYSSFSLIPDDPSLLFTIAGMVPFKAYYLGIREPEYPCAVTSQKCVRTNDIENVGKTARHHTFFEMLGNFAWGSYFKKEAITWGWEFLTHVIGLEPEKLYATIYTDDEEAHHAWSKLVGLPEKRILRFGQDNNYWFMGETGPCGPCSEIYYDRGESFGCSSPQCGVGCGCDRFLEIWNLVFTQYDRQKDGSLLPLPHNNIDTGMGLERLTSIVQGVKTNYETDLLFPLIEYSCQKAGIRYGANPKSDMAVRVIADHIRSVAFMLADGVLPANEGPGYVVRRLLRRALRYGRILGFEGPFLCEYLPVLINIMGKPYAELAEQRLSIEQIIEVEESRFEKTLIQGTELLNSEVARLKLSQTTEPVLSGEVAFSLYDTYGFPLELTLEMADEQGVSVDHEGFEKAMTAQRERARSSSKQKKSAFAGDVYTELENEFGSSLFTGYQNSEGEAKILAILTKDGRTSSVSAPSEFEVILDSTPFYAERGGEVGDTGVVTLPDGGTLAVKDTLPHGGIISHRVTLDSGEVTVGEQVHCRVDTQRREAIRRNHTATHLLHETLGRILGGHVRQAGSLVADQLLRFDFTHHEALSRKQIDDVETMVNTHILANLSLKTTECGREEARNMGAKALFDEKYGEVVRVVSVSDFSTELCGGLHVRSTGEIGLFKIVREESIGSGTRRIVALTGMNSLFALQKVTETIGRLTGLLAADESNLLTKAEGLMNEIRNLQRQAQDIQKQQLTENAGKFFERQDIAGITWQIGKFTSHQPANLLREVGDKAKSEHTPTVIVLASIGEGEACQLLVMADDAAISKGANAGALVKEGAAILDGRGGGRPNMAQGGGPNSANLDKALEKMKTLLTEQIKN